MAHSTLLEFARINDAAAATTKKLQKQAILAEYLRDLDDEDLRRAVRFIAGRPFPATDERTLNVGWSIVSDVVLELLGLDPHVYHDLVVKSGEIGEAVSRVWHERSSDLSGAAIVLGDLEQAFADLANVSSAGNRTHILREIFSRCRDGREAAYLAKIIFRDMRTGVQEGVLQHAIAEAFGRDVTAIQRCQLLVGDLGEVAVLARQDALCSARFTLFHPIQFMLANAQETADEAAATIGGRKFLAEDKLDGIRAQVHKSGGRIEIYTRTMDRTDASFPDVVANIAKLPGEFLLDGEIVPYRDGQVLPFAHIQKRLGRKALTPAVLRDNPAMFIAFDLLYRDGALLMEQPLRQRRRVLEELAGGHGLLITRVADVSNADEIEAAFCLARDCRNEGLVLKDPDSIYSPGRRGKMWLKLKTHLPTLDVVVTAAEFGHGKRRQSLSDYTFAVWDRDPHQEGAKLVNIGKAYIGVTDEEIARFTEFFPTITYQRHGRMHLVQPQVVLEIAADQIQKSQRYVSGYALRFPRIKRIRWDKKPQDADRIDRVAEIYESQANFGRGQSSAEPPPAKEPTLFD